MRSQTLRRMQQDDSEFDRAIGAHDRALAATQLAVWVGAEPTFTDRYSQQPQWLNQALGEEKRARAARLLGQLCRDRRGALVLRCVGRQYEAESRPRWSFGVYQRRDGSALWQGPVDPLLGEASGQAQDAAQRLQALHKALGDALNRQGWGATAFELADRPLPLRILFRVDGQAPPVDAAADERLRAASLHEQKTPVEGLADPLADEGLLLLKLGSDASENALCLELPRFPDVATFLRFVGLVAQVCGEAGVAQLIWQGHPPPVDAKIAWATVTPDPAVIEVNQAPATCVSEFLEELRRLFAAARAVGLAPERLQFNGQVSDSGGGGQFTLGGPEPLSSPFIVAPQTLPRLIRYLIRHPALSYWFAPAYVGGSSQAPRPDEGVRDSFNALALALHRLGRQPEPEPEFIWRSLNNFLVDPSGNSHRSELNIEKLWNPYLPQRGCLGLVEFRAFRMLHSAEQMAAVAALLRSLVAMLGAQDRVPELTDWGDELHERFALPFYLRQDLTQVLGDLREAGLGLDRAIASRLLDDADRQLARAQLDGCELEIEQALEFWPLLGDTAMQASGDSRLVDASSQRLQLTLRAGDGAEQQLDDWSLWVEGCRLPLRQERDQAGPLRLFGVRYCSFVPTQGLYPGIQAQAPLDMLLWNERLGSGLRLSWHEWRPQGGPYDGLPDDLQQARERRQERLVIEPVNTPPDTSATPPSGALSAYTLDLRYL